MPVRRLPSNTNIDRLRRQAKELLKARAAGDLQAAQRIREFNPEFKDADDSAIFTAEFSLARAQLTIAREHGFSSWARLKAIALKPAPSDPSKLPHHERIQDPVFRRAVDLIDAGDAEGLRAHLRQHPGLARQRVVFEGENYFRNPTLLEFVAENPIRRETSPNNIVAITEIILDAGVDRSALDEALALVCSGRVARECRVQVPLINLLCERGADPNSSLHTAAAHGEFEALDALMTRGARMDLPIAALVGDVDNAIKLLPDANPGDRHRAFALASQFGRIEIVRLLLDAAEDPNRYNPVGFHSHSTPLHQAAYAGHDALVRLLIERGARVDLKDVLWQGTPADWAEHAGNKELCSYLRVPEREIAILKKA